MKKKSTRHRLGSPPCPSSVPFLSYNHEPSMARGAETRSLYRLRFCLYYFFQGLVTSVINEVVVWYNVSLVVSPYLDDRRLI